MFQGRSATYRYTRTHIMLSFHAHFGFNQTNLKVVLADPEYKANLHDQEYFNLVNALLVVCGLTTSRVRFDY